MQPGQNNYDCIKFILEECRLVKSESSDRALIRSHVQDTLRSLIELMLADTLALLNEEDQEALKSKMGVSLPSGEEEQPEDDQTLQVDDLTEEQGLE